MTATDTRPVDVNEAFRAERIAQVGNIRDLQAREAEYLAEQTARMEARVAAGELVALGGGRFQSTQGWDRGEVWTVRSMNGTSLLMPEHGLDIDAKTGKACLYTAVPAWHGLGQEIPGGISDVEDVIRLGGLDFEVYRVPAAPYAVPGVKGLVTPAGTFHVGNAATGEHWGTTGQVHRNLPVRESFAFMQNIVDSQEVIWQSAGRMNGGRSVFITAELPEGVTVDAGGIDDKVRMFLVVQDTRDGNGSYRAMLTPWRVVCQNTNRFAARDASAVVSLRHTTNLPARVEQARKLLGITVKYAGAFAEEETALARAGATLAEVEAIMAEFSAEIAGEELSGRMFGARDKAGESNRTAGSNDRREADFRQRWAVESGRVGSTLFAAEQAYTGLLDWGGVRKGTTAADRWNARITASLAGADDDKKSQLHARLLTLTTR